MAATVPNHDLDGFIKNIADGVHGAFKKGVKYGRYLEKNESRLVPMTWDEAIADDAFLEIKGEETIDAALNQFASSDDNTQDGQIGYTLHDAAYRVFYRCDYNKTWRCWARRPTNKEREAAKWDE